MLKTLFSFSPPLKRVALFQKKTGDRGKNATTLFLVLSNPRGFKEGKDSSVEFDAVPLSAAQEEADTASDIISVQGLTRPSRVADATNGQKIRLEQVVSVIAAYSPHGDAMLKRSKDVVAGTYEKPKASMKKEKAEKKKDDDDAKAPSPAPLAEKVKKTEDAAAAKDKVEAVGAGRKLLSFADLNPSAGRRLLQDDKNCGICEYVNKSGACQVAPASLDCDGIVGLSGEWACGTCESEFFFNMIFFFLSCLDLISHPEIELSSLSFQINSTAFTWNDFLGYCETVPGC
jgi:hypothetical protein